MSTAIEGTELCLRLTCLAGMLPPSCTLRCSKVCKGFRSLAGSIPSVECAPHPASATFDEEKEYDNNAMLEMAKYGSLPGHDLRQLKLNDWLDSAPEGPDRLSLAFGLLQHCTKLEWLQGSGAHALLDPHWPQSGWRSLRKLTITGRRADACGSAHFFDGLIANAPQIYCLDISNSDIRASNDSVAKIAQGLTKLTSLSLTLDGGEAAWPNLMLLTSLTCLQVANYRFPRREFDRALEQMIKDCPAQIGPACHMNGGSSLVEKAFTFDDVHEKLSALEGAKPGLAHWPIIANPDDISVTTNVLAIAISQISPDFELVRWLLDLGADPFVTHLGAYCFNLCFCDNVTDQTEVNRVLALLFSKPHFEDAYLAHFGAPLSPHNQFRLDGESLWMRWIEILPIGNAPTEPDWNATLERFSMISQRLFGDSPLPLESERFSGTGGTALHRVKSRAIASRLIELGADWKTPDYLGRNALEAQIEMPANGAVVCIMLAMSDLEFVEAMSLRSFVAATAGCSSDDPFIAKFLDRYFLLMPRDYQVAHLAVAILAVGRLSYAQNWRYKSRLSWRFGLESILLYLSTNLSKYSALPETLAAVFTGPIPNAQLSLQMETLGPWFTLLKVPYDENINSIFHPLLDNSQEGLRVALELGTNTLALLAAQKKHQIPHRSLASYWTNLTLTDAPEGLETPVDLNEWIATRTDDETVVLLKSYGFA